MVERRHDSMATIRHSSLVIIAPVPGGVRLKTHKNNKNRIPFNCQKPQQMLRLARPLVASLSETSLKRAYG